MSIGVVQTTSNYTSSGTSMTLTFGSNTTPGNCVVAVVFNPDTDHDLVSVTLGGHADNWGSLFFYDSIGVAAISIWADPACQYSSSSVVVTGDSATSGLRAFLYEISGLATTIPSLLDQQAHNEVDGTGPSWTSTAAPLTTQASEIAIGALNGYNNAGGSVTITGPSSPWVNLSQLSPTVLGFEYSGYRILSTETAVTFNGTSNMTGSNNYYAAAVLTLFGATAPVVPQSFTYTQAVKRASTY